MSLPRSSTHASTANSAAGGGDPGVPAPWSIRRLIRSGAVVLVLEGEMDIAAAPALRWCLMDGIKSDADVIVDLAETTLLDCACLGTLVRAGRRADRRGRRIVLVAPTPLVRMVLRATQLDAAFPVLRNRPEALRPSRDLPESV